ncbi:MAG: FAD-binding oxidoreductase [Pseudomonadota bacterium]
MTTTPRATPEALAAAKAALSGLDIDDHPKTVKQKSRDFFWYSPVLKARLEDVTADFVVAPRSVDEVVEVMRVAYAHDIPVTTRGAGTGNYGQAMPLAGGIVLHMKHMNRVLELAPGRIVAESGIILADLDRQTRDETGQELRIHPSTHGTASLGGFIAGGSGGVGSIRWGGLRATGNILSLKIVTCEAEPRILTLQGDDIHKANHAYGVNGAIVEVGMPLAPAYDWIDVIIGFDDVIEATRRGMQLANEDAILLKQLCTVADPVPSQYFRRHAKFLPVGKSVLIAMVAKHSHAGLRTITARWQGAEVLYDATRDGTDGLPPAYELGWNHTTLRALRVDPEVTYLQTAYMGDDPLASMARMHAMFGDEVPIHTEITRFDGGVQLSGLPLVRFTTEERLEEIIRLHEENGCPIFNPHRYTLEEGGMKQTDPLQLAFKRECDPKGLLNPGKMIAWDDPNWNFQTQRFYTYPGLASA